MAGSCVLGAQAIGSLTGCAASSHFVLNSSGTVECAANRGGAAGRIAVSASAGISTSATHEILSAGRARHSAGNAVQCPACPWILDFPAAGRASSGNAPAPAGLAEAGSASGTPPITSLGGRKAKAAVVLISGSLPAAASGPATRAGAIPGPAGISGNGACKFCRESGVMKDALARTFRRCMGGGACGTGSRDWAKEAWTTVRITIRATVGRQAGGGNPRSARPPSVSLLPQSTGTIS